METEFDINAYEQNQVLIYAVQGENESRTIKFNIIEQSGVIIPTSNAAVTNKMLDLTGYTVKLYVTRSDDVIVSCDGTVTDAQGGKVQFVLNSDMTAVKGTGSCVVVLTKDSENLRIVGITINVQASSTENTIIAIPRGSSYSFAVVIRKGNDFYELQSGDKLKFGVKKRDNDENYLITKTATAANGNKTDGYTFTLDTCDTSNLPTNTYYYDVGLQTENGKFYQVIPTSPFKVKSAITEKE